MKDEKTDSEKIVHKMLTKSTGKIEAKDRSGKLDMREDPNFSTLHMKIFGGFDK